MKFPVSKLILLALLLLIIGEVIGYAIFGTISGVILVGTSLIILISIIFGIVNLYKAKMYSEVAIFISSFILFLIVLIYALHNSV